MLQKTFKEYKMKPRNHVVLAMIKSQKTQKSHTKSKKTMRHVDKIELNQKLKSINIKDIDIYIKNKSLY